MFLTAINVLCRKVVESEEDSEEGEVSDGEYHPLVTVTKIKADDIPEVPPNRCVISLSFNLDNQLVHLKWSKIKINGCLI